jgi:hypothetical protein
MVEGEAQQLKGDMEGLNPWTSFCGFSIATVQKPSNTSVIYHCQRPLQSASERHQ